MLSLIHISADVLALLEHHLAQHHVQLRTGCTVRTLNQSRSGYAVQFETAGGLSLIHI